MYVLARVAICAVYSVGGGLIPVQELECQRGEGLIFGRIRYTADCMSL